MLAAMTHIGSENSETTMMQYIYKRRQDGVNIINMHKTWEKLLLAARYVRNRRIVEFCFWVDLRLKEANLQFTDSEPSLRLTRSCSGS